MLILNAFDGFENGFGIGDIARSRDHHPGLRLTRERFEFFGTTGGDGDAEAARDKL
jgi:hypothetical protein